MHPALLLNSYSSCQGRNQEQIIEKHDVEAKKINYEVFPCNNGNLFHYFNLSTICTRLFTLLSHLRISLRPNENQKFLKLRIAQPRPGIIDFCSGIKSADIQSHSLWQYILYRPMLSFDFFLCLVKKIFFIGVLLIHSVVLVSGV